MSVHVELHRSTDSDTVEVFDDADLPPETGGTYYPAESSDELQTVFEGLPTNLITRHETMEISVAFVAIGGLLAVIAILLGQAWRPLP